MNRRTLLLGSLIALFGAATLYAQGGGGAATAAEVESRLRNTRVSNLVLEDEPLESALERLGALLQMEIRPTPDVADEHGSSSVNLGRLNQLSVKSVLRLMLGEKGLTVIYRDGVLWVVPKEETLKNPVTRVYDVRDLTLQIANFGAPEVSLQAPGGYGGGSAMGGMMFQFDEEEGEGMDESTLADLIKEHTGRDPTDPSKTLWEEVEGADVRDLNGLLIITQVERVHEEVDSLLNLLRQFR